MRRSAYSAAIGLLIGLFGFATTIGAVSLAYPSWFSALWFGRQPGTLAAERATPPGLRPTPAGPVSTQTSKPPTPTLAPLPTAVNGACGGPEQITIALLGIDDRTTDYSPTRTDAITLVNIRFTSKTASLLSFPRDLYVPLADLQSAGINQERLNTAYLYGELYGVPGGGPAEFKATMELNFGTRVDRYVMVNFGAFEAAVDALGGIDVDVPAAIYDPQFPAESGSGTIILSIPAGLQHMDGHTALQYARTRHQDDDYHRVQRQQLALLAIRDKLLSPGVLPQIPALLQTLTHLMRTDLSPEEIATLACLTPQIDRSAITAHAIDGTMVYPWTTPEGGRVSIPNREAIAPIVAAFLGQQ